VSRPWRTAGHGLDVLQLAFDPGEVRARGTEPPQQLFPQLCRLGLPACHGILGREDDPTQQFHGGSQLRVNLLAR